MSKQIYYTQVKLRKGSSWMVTIIPDKFAVKGKFIKLKDANDSWEDGWEVLETYTKFPEEVAIHNSTLYRHQREASDL
jgi:hypothetical protein